VHSKSHFLYKQAIALSNTLTTIAMSSVVVL